MKRATLWLLALTGSLAATSACHAQYYCAPALYRPLAYGPDMRGMGYTLVNCYGQPIGPCYYPYPQYSPEMGVVMPFHIPQKHSAAQNGQLANTFPTHPYMRSPRDFFMWRENMEDQRGRDVRPFQVP